MSRAAVRARRRRSRQARATGAEAPALTAAASGSTSLPLSERERAWDATAADGRVRTWASSDGSGDKEKMDWGKYGSAFFWRDTGEGAPEDFGSFKLGFADVIDGTLTAIWRGVTASAGAVQGARGGVQIPDADRGGVKGKIGTYYRKAAKQYEDPSITPPWTESAVSDAVTLAVNGEGEEVAEIDADALMVEQIDRLAYAEVGPGKPGDLAAAKLAWTMEFASDQVEAAEMQAEEEDDRETRVLNALLAAGVEDPNHIETVYDLAMGSPGERAFLTAVSESGHRQIREAAWPCEAELGEHGEEIYRDEHEAVFRLDDGRLAHVRIAGGWLHANVAAESRSGAGEVVAAFSTVYPPLYRDSDESAGLVPVTFWSYGDFGPRSRLRMIEAQSWAEIERNYPPELRVALDRMMHKFEPGATGQLILWQGSPGTGKTWALRALASEWADWAEFSYITDPDAFFVSKPSYLVDVLLADSYEELTVDDEVVTSQREGKWRVLVLEDTGELLSANAKREQGQGLSRLLNVVDGLVGQGLRVLVLVTTNDELGELHPAAIRPGRCAAQLSFGSFSAEEATDWLGSPLPIEAVKAGATLAELYALVREGKEALAEMQDEGACADCGHAFDMHEGDGGACTMEGCDCEAYAAPEGEAASVSAAMALYSDTSTNTPMLLRVEDSVLLADIAASRLAQGVDLPEEHRPADQRPPLRESVPEPMPVATGLRWEATLAPEGRTTDDGRLLAPGSISWRELPLSLMAMTETADGHDGAEVSGRIDEIHREGYLIRGTGIFDDSEFGAEIARMVDERILRGISVDLAIRHYQVGPKEAFFHPDGTAKTASEIMAESEVEENEEEENPIIAILLGGDEDAIMAVVDGVIGAVTVCPFPAFAEASISLVSSGDFIRAVRLTIPADFTIVEAPAERASAMASGGSVDPPPLTASAEGLVPVVPPASWFDDPQLDRLTPLTIEDSGRVYGHIAPWGTCHIGFPGVCKEAPHSMTDYRIFHTGAIMVEDGEAAPGIPEAVDLPIGSITLGTGHAGPTLSATAALAHYDNTGTAIVDVRVGEDEHGIWTAGALRSGLTDERVRELRAAKLSGDWRNVDGNLELVAILAVNVGGFPVPRPRAIVASMLDEEGIEHLEVLALTSFGVHSGDPLTPKERAEIEMLAARASESHAEVEALARRANP